MIINFSAIDYSERPTLILKNAGGTPIGVLGYASLVTPNISYNETSVLEFSLPACVDGEPVPFYDEVVGMRVVELRGIGQFTLVNPVETGDGIKRIKACKGYSLEYEFARKKITLEAGTFKFWDFDTTENTLLGRIMELMPSWSVGDVDTNLLTRYRTFEAKSDNVYNFIKNGIQQSYGCIFTFDTLNRLVHVRDADEEPADTAVYISHENLAKEIVLEENTEEVFTRIDVSGAEGVDIRDVNPTGTNQIINLDYYMTPENFSQQLIDKYFAWKKLIEDNKRSYYLLSVQYSLKLAQREAETANLVDQKGELSNLENMQAIAIQGIAQGLGTQGDLDKANADIADQKTVIEEQNIVLERIQAEADEIFAKIKAIRDACHFDGYFSKDEIKELDRYINDTEIADSSFAVTNTDTYENEPEGNNLSGISVSITNCEIETTKDAAGTTILSITGGHIQVGDVVQASVISSIVEVRGQNIVATIYTGEGTRSGMNYPSGCMTLSGSGSSIVSGNTSRFSCTFNGYMYFTLDATEYEKRNIAWDLYEYGEGVLSKVSSPSYTFKITSANFFSIEEFETFKNALRLGERIYIRISDDRVLSPILIGVKFEYDQPDSIELSFSDSFTSSDSAFKLVDLLEQGVSMGKNLDISKYIYSSFVDSGAETGIKTFMKSALDVAKNAIMSSTNQAVSWDGSGIRLRRYANEAKTAYEDEQIWMNNNSILMTDDGWNTAKLAIGKFHDPSLGTCWGIVADRIVGTLIAGSSMIIESEKKSGGVSVFRMDSDGCRLYNGDFSVLNGNTHITINPDVGIVVGKYPVYNENQTTGHKTLNTNNARFWADTNGNVHFTGTLHGANGEFTGYIKAIHNDGAYFQVDGTHMGFYSKDGTPLMQYSNGSMTLTGAINATSLHIQTNGSTHTLDRYINDRIASAGLEVTDDYIVATVRSSSDYQGDLANKADLSAVHDLRESMLKLTDEYIITTVCSSKTYKDALNDKASNGLVNQLKESILKLTDEYIVATVRNHYSYKTDLDGKADLDTVTEIQESLLELTPERITMQVISHTKFQEEMDGKLEEEDIQDIRASLLELTDEKIVATVLRSNEYKQDLASLSVSPDSIIATVTGSTKYQEDMASKVSTSTITILENMIEQRVTSGEAESLIQQKLNSITLKASQIALEGYVTANGNFSIDTYGTLTAKNGIFSGTLSSGNWTFDSSGARYKSGNIGVNMTVLTGNFVGNGTSSIRAFYGSSHCDAQYGSDYEYTTFIRSGDIQFIIQDSSDMSDWVSARFKRSASGQICFVCGESEGSSNTDTSSSGNLGYSDQYWDYTFTRVLRAGTYPGSSSRTIKQDIEALPEMGDILDKIEPVQFAYKNDPDTPRYGFIYEDMKEILPVVCFDDGMGDPGIVYTDMISPMLKEIQSLRRRVAALEAQIQ